MDMWDGPVHYVSVQHVVNPKSATTPLRLVINSSLKCPKTGLSLNDILAKGPNLLNDLWELLIRFRSYKVGLISDITKAYHSMRTGPLEKHLRRVVWRHADNSRPWKVYGFMVVTFGDRPAAALLEIVIRMTVQLYGHIDPLAASRLLSDMFVDDLETGGELHEVIQFRGQEDPETLQCSGTMPEILRQGGLHLKAMQYSGEDAEEKLAKLGGSVLGLKWTSHDDRLSINLAVNLSKRRRGLPTGPDLTVDDLPGLQKVVLTRRLCLSVANSVYDPIGMASPLTIRLKVAMKRMFAKEHNLGWDTPLAEELREEWFRVICDMVKTGEVQFHRASRPLQAIGQCVLVIFFDGSDKASAGTVYAVWQVAEGQEATEVRLVASKAKVAPDWDMNTPRMELSGAVVATRLGVKVCRAMETKPSRVWIAGDSEIVLASREKNSGFFSEWFSNRIGETHDNQRKMEDICPVGDGGEWWHISGQLNPADQPTRLTSGPQDILMGSEWQSGKEFLKMPRETWPFERKFAEDRRTQVEIPREEVNKRYRGMLGQKDMVSLAKLEIGVEVQKSFPARASDVQERGAKKSGKRDLGPGHPENPVVKHFLGGLCTNDWDKLVEKTAVLFRWLEKTLAKRQTGGTGTARSRAVLFWIRVAMPATREAHAKGKLSKLSLWEHDGVLVVTGRAQAGLRYYLGADYLPVLMSSTRVAELIMLWAHNRDHSNRDTTLMTATQLAWIVGGRRLAGKIKDFCIRSGRSVLYVKNMAFTISNF